MMDKPGTYTKRPVSVEAMQYTAPNQPEHGGNVTEILDWGATVAPSRTWNEDFTIELVIAKSNGMGEVRPGDWIIKERDGSGLYPCTAAEFEQTYVEAAAQ